MNTRIDTARRIASDDSSYALQPLDEGEHRHGEEDDTQNDEKVSHARILGRAVLNRFLIGERSP